MGPFAAGDLQLGQGAIVVPEAPVVVKTRRQTAVERAGSEPQRFVRGLLGGLALPAGAVAAVVHAAR